MSEGGWSLTGVAVTTETAITAETVKTVTVASLSCTLWDKQKEGRMLLRAAKPVETTKAIMKPTPLNSNPLVRPPATSVILTSLCSHFFCLVAFLLTDGACLLVIEAFCRAEWENASKPLDRLQA